MGVVELGELSRYCCLELPIESSCQIYYTTNIPPKHHEILHYFDLRRHGPRWRRHVWNEEAAKQWAEHKAMESCFGENMMKTSLLKMKKAVVKCTGQDMPELDLPMYKSPHRFV